MLIYCVMHNRMFSVKSCPNNDNKSFIENTANWFKSTKIRETLQV